MTAGAAAGHEPCCSGRGLEPPALPSWRGRQHVSRRWQHAEAAASDKGRRCRALSRSRPGVVVAGFSKAHANTQLNCGWLCLARPPATLAAPCCASRCACAAGPWCRTRHKLRTAPPAWGPRSGRADVGDGPVWAGSRAYAGGCLLEERACHGGTAAGVQGGAREGGVSQGKGMHSAALHGGRRHAVLARCCAAVSVPGGLPCRHVCAALDVSQLHAAQPSLRPLCCDVLCCAAGSPAGEHDP